ncbi:hypothetical protein PG997_010434 [Apiospora hydei]|uniref:Uncharacterized protein n=1 Tax=Apiospora hydei TaxID=1337664 RepID=A0ABR1VZL9_9PEZI
MSTPITSRCSLVSPQGKGPTAWEQATPEQKTKAKTQMILFPFCAHCGRKEIELNDPEDLFHHHLTCRGSNAGSRQDLKPSPFCKVCGEQATADSSGQLQCTNPSCKSHEKNATYDEDYCDKCGFNLSGCSQAYRILHDHWCRALPGGPWNGTKGFCPFCGISFQGLDHEEREQHVWDCSERPSPKPTKCPICCPWCKQYLVGKATNTEYSDPGKHYHFFHHMGQVPKRVQPQVGVDVGNEEIGVDLNVGPDSRCPYWSECGARTSDMTNAQWNKHMENCHSANNFYPNGMPDSIHSAPPTNYGKTIPGMLAAYPARAGGIATGAKTGNSNGSIIFNPENWGGPIIDNKSDSSSSESDHKRPRITWESDPDNTEYIPSQEIEEPPEEYMDTRLHSDSAENLELLLQERGEDYVPGPGGYTLGSVYGYGYGHGHGHGYGHGHGTGTGTGNVNTEESLF